MVLFKIALENSQVCYILRDLDVSIFYKKLIYSLKTMTKEAQDIMAMINEDDL